MFGKNKLYKVKDFADKENLFVKDIFHTIQGEAIFSGTPATFIRLAYCSIACTFCDTDFETDIVEMSVDEVINKVKEITPSTTNLIVLTGGEPLLQPKISELCRGLINEHYKVQIETSGTICPVDLPLGNTDFVIICSPKTGKINSNLEQWINAYKYIIKEKNYSDEDGLPIYSTQVEGLVQKLARPLSRSTPIYISPMDEYNEKQNKLNLTAVTNIALKYGYKISLQIHKILNVA